MINLELETLYYNDKKDRGQYDLNGLSMKELQDRDQLRLLEVYKLLKESKVDKREIWNCHYLALLLQHGQDPSDFKLAHNYAKMAVDMGSRVTKWLYAATLYRYLLSIGKKQKFGTQFIVKGSKMKLAPYDKGLSENKTSK